MLFRVGYLGSWAERWCRRGAWVCNGMGGDGVLGKGGEGCGWWSLVRTMGLGWEWRFCSICDGLLWGGCT